MRNAQSRSRLPSLNALKAFDVAARFGSLTRAADVLGVTQGAVSRQVKELEQQLGLALFVRRGPRLQLTGAGTDLAGTTATAFRILADGVAALRGRSDSPVVTLSMLPSVAAKFMAPRLERFVADHPDIDLRLSTTRALVDFRDSGIDAAVRYGRGPWPGLHAERLGGERLFPVCSPDYAARLELRTPADLTRATLFPTDLPESWSGWMVRAGAGDVPVREGPTLGDFTAVLQAVLDGAGIALGRSVLVREELRSGRLVAPFARAIDSPYSYWFVAPPDRADDPPLRAIATWLKHQFTALEAAPDP